MKLSSATVIMLLDSKQTTRTVLPGTEVYMSKSGYHKEDLTDYREAEPNCVSQSEVLLCLHELEVLANCKYVKAQLRSEGSTTMTGKMRCYLNEATPFESTEGDVSVMAADEYAFVIGGHWDEDSDVVLTLEREIEGVRFSAEVPYANLTPYIEGVTPMPTLGS